jgi:hypothetical protein
LDGYEKKGLAEKAIRKTMKTKGEQSGEQRLVTGDSRPLTRDPAVCAPIAGG